MEYRLIALDLDGTLTNSQKRISPATKSALMTAQANGMRIALVSGRPTHGVEPLARELNLHAYGGFIVSYNGGRVFSCTDNKVLYQRSVPEKYLPFLCELPHRHRPLTAIVYKGDTLLTVTAENPYVQMDARINHLRVEQVPDLLSRLDYPVGKFLFPGDADYIAELLPKLQAQLPELSIYCSEPFYLEVMPAHVDKGHTLSVLLEHLGLSREQLVAFGDGFNDVSMLRFAGTGVAMGNAQAPTKAAADFITRSNDEDGIVYALERFGIGA